MRLTASSTTRCSSSLGTCFDHTGRGTSVGTAANDGGTVGGGTVGDGVLGGGNVVGGNVGAGTAAGGDVGGTLGSIEARGE